MVFFWEGGCFIGSVMLSGVEECVALCFIRPPASQAASIIISFGSLQIHGFI